MEIRKYVNYVNLSMRSSKGGEDLLNEEITDIGERVKRARKRVGLTQSGVAGGEVTRETISQVERGIIKTLTLKTAEIIVKNINKAAKDKGLDYRITVKKLLRNEEDIIEDLLDEHLKELKVSIMSNSEDVKNKIKEIEILFKDIADDKKEKIYENAIDYFFDNYEYEDAKTYILKCYAIAFRKNENEKLIESIYKLISIYTKQYDYKQVIKFMEHAEYIAEVNNLKNHEFMRKIYFHAAMAFRKNGEYKKCIYLLEKIKTMFTLDKKEILDIDTVLGRCYEKIKEYKKSENKFLNILSLSIDTEYVLMVALAYTNLAYVHFKQDNSELAIKYIDKAKKIKIEDYNKVAEIYYRAFQIYSSYCKNFNDVEEMFLDAIHKSNIVKNNKLKEKVIIKMMKYCIRNVNEGKLLSLLSRFEQEINLSKDATKIYFKAYAFLKDIKSKNADMVFEKCRNTSEIINDDI